MADNNTTTKEEHTKTERREVTGVLPRNLGGGPHGLGDPNDRSLRKIEKNVLIPKKIREKTRREKCVPEFTAFAECGIKEGLLVVANCREENKAVWACASRWWHDKEFVEECTKEYIDERNEYRRTGIGVKQKRMSSTIQY